MYILHIYTYLKINNNFNNDTKLILIKGKFLKL